MIDYQLYFCMGCNKDVIEDIDMVLCSKCIYNKDVIISYTYVKTKYKLTDVEINDEHLFYRKFVFNGKLCKIYIRKDVHKLAKKLLIDKRQKYLDKQELVRENLKIKNNLIRKRMEKIKFNVNTVFMKYDDPPNIDNSYYIIRLIEDHTKDFSKLELTSANEIVAKYNERCIIDNRKKAIMEHLTKHCSSFGFPNSVIDSYAEKLDMSEQDSVKEIVKRYDNHIKQEDRYKFIKDEVATHFAKVNCVISTTIYTNIIKVRANFEISEQDAVNKLIEKINTLIKPFTARKKVITDGLILEFGTIPSIDGYDIENSIDSYALMLNFPEQQLINNIINMVNRQEIIITRKIAIRTALIKQLDKQNLSFDDSMVMYYINSYIANTTMLKQDVVNKILEHINNKIKLLNRKKLIENAINIITLKFDPLFSINDNSRFGNLVQYYCKDDNMNVSVQVATDKIVNVIKDNIFDSIQNYPTTT